jgi:hypothetical protein
MFTHVGKRNKKAPFLRGFFDYFFGSGVAAGFGASMYLITSAVISSVVTPL